MTQSKRCATCGKDRHLAAFPKKGFDNRGEQIYRHQCKLCFRDKQKSRYRERKEAYIEKLAAKANDFDIDVVLEGGEWQEIDRAMPKEQEELSAKSDLERVLFIPDCHHPYVDLKKWGLMLRAAMKFKPDTIIVLGDFADFYAVSSHSKDPSRRHGLREELDEVRKAITQLEQLGAKNNIYVCGNHEDRFDRFIADKAPELHNLVSLRDALGLDNWTWVPYKSHFNLGKLHITHDCGNAGGDAHKKAQATFEGNVIIGHTHRIGYTVVGNAEGKPHLGAMLGWLGDIEEVDYMHRIKVLRDWAHGFGIGYLMKDGVCHVVPVPIVNNSVIIEGKLIT